MVDRRRLLALATSAAAARLVPSGLASAQCLDVVSIGAPKHPARLMPLDFTGLSFEAGQLYNPEYFSPRNTALIQAFRHLTPHGVLRLGGHLSNITPWEGVGQDDPKQVRGVRHGIEDYWEWPLVDPSIQKNKRGMLTHKALANLRGFLDAVDWRLLYTLNFASGSAERAADEASAVAETMGPRLLAFLVGNEVDGYHEDPFFRSPDYTFERYFAEYRTWVDAVRRKVPRAPFAGPDTEGHIDSWVLPFAERTRGDAVLITSHYYGMGPASAPGMTADRLLQKNNPELEQQIAGALAASTAAGGTPYRMDEGNSCFGGGKPGVSDAYPSALWAADYMLHVACAGFAGVNFHGGGTGFYTPIESSEHAPVAPRPMYYGIQFAQQFAGYRLAACELKTEANVTAYMGMRGNEKKLAIINKGPQPVRFQLPHAIAHSPVRRCWILKGPSLDAKTGVTFTEELWSKLGSVVNVLEYSASLLQA